jgi:predicted phosphatase
MNNLDKPPTERELNAALRYFYQKAVNSGLFVVQFNVSDVQKKVREVRVLNSIATQPVKTIEPKPKSTQEKT